MLGLFLLLSLVVVNQFLTQGAFPFTILPRGFPGGISGKEFACQCRRHLRHAFDCWVGVKGTATHSSILAWRIPWTEEPGGIQSVGLQGVGHS